MNQNLAKLDRAIHEQRDKRFKQIFWATQLALFLAVIQRLYLGNFGLAPILIFLAILISPTYFLSTNGKNQQAANLFLGLLSAGFLYMVWKGEGQRDEAMLALPCILVFAAMLGSRTLFISLLVIFCSSTFLNGYVNDSDLFNNEVSKPSTHSSIPIIIIMSITGLAVWLLSSDMNRIAQKLFLETKRVQQSKKEVEKLVNYDQLTGLPNRALAQKFYERSFLKHGKEKPIIAIMFLDLDNFKSINDSLGHQVGDKYLQKIAELLSESIRAYDVVCRQGGDEFVVIAHDIQQVDDISAVAIKILDKLNRIINIDGHKLVVSCSIGIAFAPSDGEDFNTLLKKADIAMYHAKSLGKNAFCFYDENMNVQAHESIQLSSEMRIALEEEQFILHYQAKYDLLTEKIIGAEALIRWQHPQRGMIPPNLFIPIAEKYGLIPEIGKWVMKEACLTCSSWHKAGFDDLHVAVNVSPLQFKRGNLELILHEVLAHAQLAAASLEIEMTESLLIDDTESLRNTLTNLRQLGVTFSIDDFGTGYSNLGYLKKFDIETLKIDQSFIQQVTENANDKAIVEAIIQMAKKLDLKTVAEGIETAEQAAMIKAMDCTIGQGFYWSKPLPSDEFLALIKNSGDQL